MPPKAQLEKENEALRQAEDRRKRLHAQRIAKYRKRKKAGKVGKQ